MACDACRASKVRCRPSKHPGVCRKCLETRRECVTRVGLQGQQVGHQVQTHGQAASQAPATPATEIFRLNFAVPSQNLVDDGFETLMAGHVPFLEALFGSDLESESQAAAGISATSSGGSSAESPAFLEQTHPIQDFSANPKFSVATAEMLLQSFWAMLNHFPCILLPHDASFQQLASEKPFVLLAILASASASKTLQGHNLYDEEFRKVLGIKFMSGGERSLELLQGILIYCAWYPFHVRPKRHQMLQFVRYIRVASEMVQDLQLDQASAEPMMFSHEGRDHRLEKIRSYLSYCYLVTSAMFAWKQHPWLVVNFTPWTMVCIDILERNAQSPGDRVLVALSRLAAVVNDAAQAVPGRKVESAQQSRLVWLGLETQRAEIVSRFGEEIAANPSVKIASLYTKIFLGGGPKLKFPGITGPASHRPEFLYPTISALTACAEAIGAFFNYILSLDRSVFFTMSCIDWTRLIGVIIVSIRISFPQPESPEWDPSWARYTMGLSEFLARFCDEFSPGVRSSPVDILSASRVVMGMVKEKYDRKVSRQSDPMQDPSVFAPSLGSCPMLDGSLNQHISAWDGTHVDGSYMANTAAGNTGVFMEPASYAFVPSQTHDSSSGQQSFADPWETIAMNWATRDAEGSA